MEKHQNCGNCGTELIGELSFCRSCGSSVRSVNDMKCQTCGNDNPSDSRFCGFCGTSLISGEASVESELPMVGLDEASVEPELPMVSLDEAIIRGFRNYANFSGRATRAEYWWFALFNAIGTLVLGVISFFAGFPIVLDWMFAMVILIPSLALGARRLHDNNRTGWWLLLAIVPALMLLYPFLLVAPWLLGQFVPVFGWFTVIFFTCKRGDYGRGNYGSNKYGPDPRRPTSEASVQFGSPKSPLSQAIKAAAKKRLIPRNPADVVSPPRAEKREDDPRARFSNSRNFNILVVLLACVIGFVFFVNLWG